MPSSCCFWEDARQVARVCGRSDRAARRSQPMLLSPPRETHRNLGLVGRNARLPLELIVGRHLSFGARALGCVCVRSLLLRGQQLGLHTNDDEMARRGALEKGCEGGARARCCFSRALQLAGVRGAPQFKLECARARPRPRAKPRSLACNERSSTGKDSARCILVSGRRRQCRQPPPTRPLPPPPPLLHCQRPRFLFNNPRHKQSPTRASAGTRRGGRPPRGRARRRAPFRRKRRAPRGRRRRRAGSPPAP